jgi:hypothetical protein
MGRLIAGFEKNGCIKKIDIIVIPPASVGEYLTCLMHKALIIIDVSQ